jgi:hypothetical protein
VLGAALLGLAWHSTAHAADPAPAIDPAKLGPPMLVMSPPLPPTKAPRPAPPSPPAKKIAAARPAPPPAKRSTAAAPVPGQPLIPPAVLPAKLDPPPKPRPSLPLQIELQPLNPFEAPRHEQDRAAAGPPTG